MHFPRVFHGISVGLCLLATAACEQAHAEEPAKAAIPKIREIFEQELFDLAYTASLAKNAPEEALETAEKALNIRPSDPLWRKKAAHAAELSRSPKQALEHWFILAKSGDETAQQAVLRISRSIGELSLRKYMLEQLLLQREDDPELVNEYLLVSDALLAATPRKELQDDAGDQAAAPRRTPTGRQTAQPGPTGMVLRADRMVHETATDTMIATGNVHMTWQDMVMTADEATYNRTTQIMTARGNVYLFKTGDAMWGEQMVLDTETGRAEMEKGRIYMAQGNFHVKGQQIAKMGDDQYALNKGDLTSCDAEVPSWKFGGTEMDFTTDEYATGKNVIFYVKDIPVFYFPYLMLPVKKERQSGFLFPRFGASTKRGEFYEQPFYWAISPSQEATLLLDLQTKRGVGLGVDYRYLRSRTSDGSMGGYLIRDNNEKKVRGKFLQVHKEQFPDDLSLITSINLTSDKTFLTDYEEKSGEYNRQYYDSRVVLTKNWDTWMTGAQAIYTQDFYAGSNTTTLQRAPELLLYGARQAVPFIPSLWFDLDLLLTNYYREKGMQGQRAAITPRLTTNHTLFDGRLNTTVFGGLQIRGYNSTEADPGIKEKAMVAIPEFGAEISSSLSRIYDKPLLGMTRLRHEIVPTLRYSYTTEKDQTSYPMYDQSDRTPHVNLINFSLASHLGGKVERAKDQKGADVYRHLQTLRLNQGYSLGGIRPYLLSEADAKKPWSDATIESETWLHPLFRLLVDAGYNHYKRKVTTTALGGDYNDGKGNIVGTSYRMTDQQVEYLEGRISLALFKPVYLAYTNRFSFDKQKSLESHTSIEYRHQCWSVLAIWRERPNDRSWTINFNLAGLFSIGGSGGLGGGGSATTR